MLSNLLAVLAWLVTLIPRRQPRTVTEETYAAKAAEAKELAKPDADWTVALTACDPQPVTPAVTYCPTAIHPDPQTRAWLRTLTPPPPAVHYFNLVANQQALFDRGCR